MGDRQKTEWQRKIPVCDGRVAGDHAQQRPFKAVVRSSGLSAQCSNQQDKACGLRVLRQAISLPAEPVCHLPGLRKHVRAGQPAHTGRGQPRLARLVYGSQHVDDSCYQAS